MKAGKVLVFAVNTMPLWRSLDLLNRVVEVTSQDGRVSMPRRHSLSCE